MDLPKGFSVGDTNKNHVLKLIRNIYGQKQAGRVWNDYLMEGLKSIGFTQSQYDMCLLWRDLCVLVIYTDDTIVTGPDEAKVKQVIKDIASKFTITSSEGVEDFLGVNTAINPQKGEIKFSQPQLIRSIINDLGLDEKSKTHKTPALSNVVLHAHEDSPCHIEPWSYRAVIGKLNFLEKSSRPDISYAVHQCSRFCECPKIEHTAAVKRIGRYLLSSMDQGITCLPNDNSLVVLSDASFLGEWVREIAPDDPITARSRTGYVILYGTCPVSWSSKLQTEIAHSATEAEYVALSQLFC
jgi:Reverse transcriptase (RNA-dependent DNA polymerase)